MGRLPMMVELKLYGGAAKFCACVKLTVKKHEADQETTNEANSTMGKVNSFQGVNSSIHQLVCSSAGCQRRNCALEGLPLPRYGSAAAVSECASCDMGSAGFSLISSTLLLEMWPLSVEETSLWAAAGELWPISDGCIRCHLVSGKRKVRVMVLKANMATLSHQKERQPTACAMGPAMMGPTMSEPK